MRPNPLADRPILACAAPRREHDLPQLIGDTAAECTGKAEQIIAPHSAKSRVAEKSTGPDMCFEGLPPCQRRAAVIETEIMPVFKAEQPSGCFRQMLRKWQLAIGKYVFANPEIAAAGAIGAHRLEEKHAVRR